MIFCYRALKSVHLIKHTDLFRQHHKIFIATERITACIPYSHSFFMRNNQFLCRSMTNAIYHLMWYEFKSNFSLSTSHSLSLSQTHTKERRKMMIPNLILKCRWLFSAEFLLLLLITGNRGSWLLSATTEGRIQTICKNSMWKYGVLNSQCGCVIPAASVYPDSLITQRHQRNVAVGARLEILLQLRVQ